MEIRCVNCGAVLAGPPPAGLPFHCNFCGAPQPTAAAPPQNPYAAGPSPYGAPPSPYGAAPPPYGAQPQQVLQLQQPGMIAPRANPVGVAVAAGVVIMIAGGLFAFLAARPHAPGSSGLGGAGGMPTKALATLSLAQTPDAMAKITGVLATVSAMGDTEMDVKLSGGPIGPMDVTWDKTDPSHAKQVYLYPDTPPPNYAAVHAKLAALLGPRLDAKGNMNWQGGFFSYNVDGARTMGYLTEGAEKNPHWKQQVDAGWDVLRSVALGLPVTVTEADTRDWLARGYPLQSLGAIDPAVDVDRSTAMMQAAFPGAASRQVGNLEFMLAIDNPWFSEAGLDWPNKKGAVLEEVNLRPLPGAPWVFPDQNALEACVQNLLGGKPERRETDHLKGTHSTEWNPAEGGSVSVDESIVWVRLVSPFVKKSMGHAEYQRIMTGLGGCAPKK